MRPDDDLLGRPLALVVALALVSLLPFVFMSVTSFVKISTVLQIVRGAIGAQNVPSSTVIMARAGALTLLAMAPVGDAIYKRAAPLVAAKLHAAIQGAVKPLGLLQTPPDVGFPYTNGTQFIVQVHYNNINQLANEMDSSGFDLCTTDQLRPNDADVLAFGSVKFTIPPHDGLDITCSVTIPQEYSGIHVIAAFPHMHELGKLIETSLVPAPGGPSLDLGSQPTWNFQSQLWFPLTQDVELGDVVNTRCAWENTTDAPVGFGPYTEDEMCYSFTMYYPKITATTWYWGAPALTSKCSPTVSQ